MRAMATTGLAAWLLAAALAASAQIATGPGDKVLVLTRDPSVGAEVEKALRARRVAQDRAGLDIRVDQQLLQPHRSADELAKVALAAPTRYRAAYVTTMALARAVQQADPRVPVVFKGAADPTEMCLVDSPQRPGRSATGFTTHLPAEGEKMLELLLDGFPALRRIYFVVGGSNVDLARCAPRTAAVVSGAGRTPCVAGAHAFDLSIEQRMNEPGAIEAGRRRGVEVRFLLLCTPSDLTLLQLIDRQRNDVGYALPWQFIHTSREQQIVDLVGSVRRPAIYGRTRFAELGGLMAIESLRDPGDEHRAIDMLIQVLDGRPPATLPVQMPRGFRLTVNAAAAADMQLRPSLGLLRRADDIIVRKPADR